LDEAQEAWFEEGQEKGWELAEAKYRPVIAEQAQALTEQAREIEELRRKLWEAGINN
jgi:hypothetical protein